MLKWCWKSFQKIGSWILNGSDSQAKSEMSHEPSTGINQKRGHQMSMDASKQELLYNKKQAVESVNIEAASKEAILNDPLRHDASNYHPEGQIGDGLFIPKPVGISDASDKNVPSIDSSSLNIKTKDSEDQLGNDLADILSMHRSFEDPLCLKTGVRRVKVKEVKISENRSPELVENSFCLQKENEPRLENGMSFEHTYSAFHGGPLIVNPSFSRTENYIYSLGQASSERDGSYILDNQYNNWVNNIMPYTGHAFDGGNYNTTAMLNWYQKENVNFMSVCPTHNYCHGNFFTIYPFFNCPNEALYPTLSSSKELNAIRSMTSYQDHREAVVPSPRINFHTENSSPLPLSDDQRNSEQTTTPFQGLHENAGENDSSGGLVSSCAVLPFQSSGALGDRDQVRHQSLNVISASSSKIDGAQKNKEKKATKRTSRNNFPANVKSLLSTGILDGVPVKYVSWSREMTLRGVVNGTHYLCGCQECKLVKVQNAYEFESHAGCKTKHPNNHIYFENGKTVYAVAQELKYTPREMLFDVIQNVTGSMINQKKFEIWKASYKEATTRYLQRGHSKTDAIMPS
ncbi:uncharacterized protein LOC142524853 isoform X1 [Primulina tabacum]|uniref:uncharacterized protein LOC142524853 isoform X1 n=1 Tax=Primulina tabacum TaxID=48773 RepID=UPI003F59ACD7